MARKLIRFAAVVDASITYELLELLTGKAVAGTLEMHPVKSSAESEDGKLQNTPTGRELVLAYASAHPTFKSIDVKTEGARLGMNRSTIYSAITVLTGEGALKNIGHGMYALRKGAAKQAAKVVKGKHKPKPKAPRGSDQTVAAKMLASIRKLQNGSGEGVHIQQIKKTLGKAGIATTGTSPTLAKLMKDKLVTRTAPAHYRAVEA
jgi:hypothetical protein